MHKHDRAIVRANDESISGTGSRLGRCHHHSVRHLRQAHLAIAGRDTLLFNLYPPRDITYRCAMQFRCGRVLTFSLHSALSHCPSRRRTGLVPVSSLGRSHVEIAFTAEGYAVHCRDCLTSPTWSSGLLRWDAGLQITTGLQTPQFPLPSNMVFDAQSLFSRRHFYISDTPLY
jgi:hypothetical protein